MIREVRFGPLNVNTKSPLDKGEAKLVSMNGNPTLERGFASVSEAYYLEPGHYQV